MKDPILIVSAPRSGSSLMGYILSTLGYFSGITKPADRWNLYGYFENITITKILVDYLKMHDVYGLGKKFQPHNLHADMVNFREAVHYFMREQGLQPDQNWFYKDPKIAICWQLFHKHFPRAKWVILQRDDEELIASIKRTEFMDAYSTDKEWGDFIDRYQFYFEGISMNCNTFLLNSSDLINNDTFTLDALFDFLKVPKGTDISKCIDKRLWDAEA